MEKVTDEDRAYMDGVFAQIQDMHMEALKNIRATTWFLLISLIILICSSGMFLFVMKQLNYHFP